MTPPGSYRVVFSGAVRELIELLCDRAAAVGIAQRVTDALRLIEGRISTNPNTWGDRIYRTRVTALDVYHRIHDGLYVVYAVHEGDRRVWLTRLYPIVGHPLYGPDERPN